MKIRPWPLPSTSSSSSSFSSSARLPWRVSNFNTSLHPHLLQAIHPGGWATPPPTQQSEEWIISVKVWYTRACVAGQPISPLLSYFPGPVQHDGSRMIATFCPDVENVSSRSLIWLKYPTSFIELSFSPSKHAYPISPSARFRKSASSDDLTEAGKAQFVWRDCNIDSDKGSAFHLL